MRILLLTFLFSSFLFSFDAYKQNSNGICFRDLTYNGNKITSTYTFEGQEYILTKRKGWYKRNATEAFYYDGVCNDEPQGGFPNQDWLELNMKEEDYHFMMALTANLLGFTLVFLVGFLFVLQGRR